MAVAKRVKVKEGENLSEANVDRVIKLLRDPKKPITKKEACQVLNISYNPKRLDTIIENHEARKEFVTKRRAANRGKPATPEEVKSVIKEYVGGATVSDIASDLFRSTSFVRDIIERVGVPQRGVGENYFTFSPLPEQCVAEEFQVGETAWSARYQAPCQIDKDMGKTKDGLSNLYRVYVYESFETPEKLFVKTWGSPGFYATQPAYELGKLDHLKEHGVEIKT